MKALALASTSFFLVLFLLSSTAFAQIQYYGIETILGEDGKAKVKLTITFPRPEEDFELSLVGRIEEFSANSLGIPMNCSLSFGVVSTVRCKLNLTSERRTVELNFETVNFVRKISERDYVFDADLSLGRNIDSVFVSVKLPEGFSLVGEEVKERLSFPKHVTILSDGRHHIITWKLLNISSEQELRFRILYEKVKTESSQIFFYFGILIIVAASISIFLYIKFWRKPEKVILSVLDEFERKVMDAIVAAGGEVNQKKIVQITNLSKAKVSRVVKSLAERGLIEIERLGRTNKLKIVKKKFKIF